MKKKIKFTFTFIHCTEMHRIHLPFKMTARYAEHIINAVRVGSVLFGTAPPLQMTDR